MQKTADNFINVLVSWLGVSEVKNRHSFIIDIYNEEKPLPRGYKVGYHDPWCATGLSAAAILCGMEDIIGKECSCEKLIDIWKQMGIWVEDGSITPTRGNIIVYNWDDSTQPNDGWADHVGVVVNVEEDYITTIECNLDNEVGYSKIPIGYGKIRGFAQPIYEIDMNAPILKSNEDVANEVIKGLWGNGEDRKSRITGAGYSYDAVMKIVNSRLAGTKEGCSGKTIEEIATEIIRGLWGNGEERKRRLEDCGYNYSIIQEVVNKMMR